MPLGKKKDEPVKKAPPTKAKPIEKPVEAPQPPKVDERQRCADLCLTVEVAVDGDIDRGESSFGISIHKVVTATRNAIRNAILEE